MSSRPHLLAQVVEQKTPHPKIKVREGAGIQQVDVGEYIIIKTKNTPAVRSNILSKLIFASCV